MKKPIVGKENNYLANGNATPFKRHFVSALNSEGFCNDRMCILKVCVCASVSVCVCVCVCECVCVRERESEREKETKNESKIL